MAATELKQEIVTVTSDVATWKNVVCDGISISQQLIPDLVPNSGFASQLQNLKELDMHDDDVIIAAYCRSGTHWTWEIINMVLKGKAEYEHIDKSKASLDWHGFDSVTSLASPRVLDTHFLPRHLPKAVAEKRTKIVHVQRNVKDVILSNYKFLLANLPDLDELVTFDTFLKYITGYYGENISLVCTWSHYVKTWEKFTKQNPDQILNIFYEDMKEDPVREIRKINDFFQCNRSDDLIRKIAQACSFDKLKQADLTKQHMIPLHDTHRKGEVGDWKNTFTVAQNEYIDQWLKKNMTDTDLKFRYEI